MLTHKTRDFTIAHFQIQLNKEQKSTSECNWNRQTATLFTTKLNHTQADAGAMLQFVV